MTIQEKFDLKGKTAIVTGGSGLLGAEFSRTLAEAGAKVIVADIDEDAAQKTASGLESAGYRAAGFGLDVTRRQSCRELVSATLSRFESLDILVNSAALDPKFDADAVSKGITPGAFEDYPL
ncbi:MAG: SDR family NAD(P)-dependent oxidoreductase, partial [Anaerolineales bacterium]|nr:SDR family NAD(P)-dependent oxidoreductase [Anaerolineales bacterium]